MASIKSYANGSVSDGTLDETAFGERLRPAVLREAVQMYEANKRTGTVNTLSRRFVNGSSKKYMRQKGSGTARHGDRKAPSMRGGGVAHGPHPRDYSYRMPRKSLRRALQVAMAYKLRDGQICRWEGQAAAKPSTKSVFAALGALGAEKSALIVSDGPVDANLLLSVRNLPRVRALPASEVSAYDVVFYRNVVLLDGAFEALLARVTTDDNEGDGA